MTTKLVTNDLQLQTLLSKPRIGLPIIKICFEIYHALRPFHHLQDTQFPSYKRSAVFLLFIVIRWYSFIKRLINDKNALSSPLSIREKFALIIALFGHILMIWAQSSTLKHENDILTETETDTDTETTIDINDYIDDKVNETGPYSIIRHPHHLGKWISESFVAVYQNNKLSMAISIITLAFTVNRANKEDQKRNENYNYQQYKRKVQSKLIPGVY